MSKIVIFIQSNAGRSRFDIESTSKIKELRQNIADKLSINISDINLSDKKDGKTTIDKTHDNQPISNIIKAKSINLFLKSSAKCIIDTTTLEKTLDFSRTSTMTVDDTQKLIDQEKEEKKKQLDKGNIMQQQKDDEKKQKEKEEEQKFVNHCQHGPQGKCPNCLDKDKIQDSKHVSFDEFLLHNKNASMPQLSSQKVNKSCKNHPPFPTSICNQCMPQTIILKRQAQRHVDFVQFMNKSEIDRFVADWSRNNHMKQKVGQMYGYQAEDPNQPKGVRAVVEAIQEPPQRNEINAFQIEKDPKAHIVESLVEALQFERLGWVFTTINNDNQLASNEIRAIAKFQENYKYLHPNNVHVSKQVTVVIRPDENNGAVPQAYMVSDLCQAMERDNLFGKSESRKLMNLRELREGEIEKIPTVMLESKEVTSFGPEFFIVNLNTGIPKVQQNYLKHSYFPKMNGSKVPTKQDAKDQFMKVKSLKDNWNQVADFHFLCWIAEQFDVGTAATLAKSVLAETPLDDVVLDQIKDFVNN